MQIIKIDFYFSLTLQDKKVIVPLGKKQKEGTVKGVNLFWAAWGGAVGEFSGSSRIPSSRVLSLPCLNYLLRGVTRLKT